MIRQIAGLAAVTALAFFPIASAQAPELIAALKDGSGKRVLVTAHRAAHDVHPENFLAFASVCFTQRLFEGCVKGLSTVHPRRRGRVWTCPGRRSCLVI